MRSDGPLVGVRVVDLTRGLGGYCGRLMRDLGAAVVHVRPPDASTSEDAAALLRGLGKTELVRGSGRLLHRRDLGDLLAGPVLLLTDDGPRVLHSQDLHPESTTLANPELVHVSITPYGLTGVDADVPATDLTVLAAGGLLFLAGDPDRPPVRPFGEQSAVAVSLHACIGALIALEVLETGGGGQVVDVSAQEAVAQATENTVQYLDCEGLVRRRSGAGPKEAGGGLFRCRDGLVYLLSTMGGRDLSWSRVVDWLASKDATGAETLRGPEWASAEFRTRPEAIERFAQIFESFSSGVGKVDLYTEGQARGISIAPVSSPRDLLVHPQLVERGFFRSWELAGRKVKLPGPPYRFSGAAVGPRPPNRKVAAPARTTSPTARQPQERGPLSGLRVADFTWVGAGPFLTKPLADHGADVIKIESRTRTDPIRSMRPFRDGIPGLNRSGYFANRNSSKRSVCLDLKSPVGHDLIRRLIAKCDVVVNNFSAGTMAALGLGYQEVKAINPEVIYLDMPMQGVTGPHKGFRGFGLTIGALSGFLDSTGWPDRPPVGTGTNYPDHVPNPYHAAIAVLAALRYKRIADVGEYIELSQLESTINAVAPALLEVQLDRYTVVRRGNDDLRMAPHGVYPCRGEERWVAIAVRSDTDWRALCAVLPGLEPGLPGVGGSSESRIRARREIDDVLGRLTAGFERDELVAGLRTAGVPAASVNDSADLLADPQLREREHWVVLDHAEMGPSVYDAPPYRLSRTPGWLHAPAPLLGADTRHVCTELLGVSPEDFDHWAEQGTVG